MSCYTQYHLHKIAPDTSSQNEKVISSQDEFLWIRDLYLLTSCTAEVETYVTRWMGAWLPCPVLYWSPLLNCSFSPSLRYEKPILNHTRQKELECYLCIFAWYLVCAPWLCLKVWPFNMCMYFISMSDSLLNMRYRSPLEAVMNLFYALRSINKMFYFFNLDIKVIFLQKICAICLVMYHLDVYKHKSVTFNQIWYLCFCWNAVLLRTESWYLSCISGLTCLFYNSLLRTLSSAFQYAASVCAHAHECVGGRLWRRKRGKTTCHADFTNTWLNQA